MYLKFTLFFAFFIFFTSCNYNKSLNKTIIIDTNSNEKFYYFINKTSDTLKFDRNIIIIKNTLSDTIVLGNALLLPKYTGKYWYGKLGGKKDVMLAPNYDNPPADRIEVNPYKDKKSKGILKFELKVITD